MTCIEELADFDDVIGDSSKKPAAKKTAVKPGSKSIAKGKTDTKKEPVKELAQIQNTQNTRINQGQDDPAISLSIASADKTVRSL